MKKMKEFFKDIEYKDLFKNIALSILILFMFLNVIFFVPRSIDVMSVSSNLDEMEIFLSERETLIQGFQKHAIQAIDSEPDIDIYTKYYAKYPSVMQEFNQVAYLLSSEVSILMSSIVTGIIVGIAIYMYKKSTKIKTLLISYLVLIIISYVLNDAIFFIDELIIFEILLPLLPVLLLIKGLKNIQIAKKLNKLVEK